MISSTTQTQTCGTHRLPNAGGSPSINDHQGSDGCRSISVEPNATGSVNHHTNSGTGTGSYARTAVKFMTSAALVLCNNASAVVGQNNTAFNGTTAAPTTNGTTAAPDCANVNPLAQGIIIGASAGLIGLVVVVTVACVAKNYLQNSSQKDAQEVPGDTIKPALDAAKEAPPAAKSEEAVV